MRLRAGPEDHSSGPALSVFPAGRIADRFADRSERRSFCRPVGIVDRFPGRSAGRISDH
jgi:hypothetical protein